MRFKFDLENTNAEGSNSVQLNILIPFLDAPQTYYYGDMVYKQVKNQIVDFQVPDRAKPGNYDIYIFIIDQKGTQAQVGDIPITINQLQQSNLLVAELTGTGNTYAGDSKDLEVTLTNVGRQTAEDIFIQMQFATTSSLIPLGTDRQYVASIGAGEKEKISFKVGVAAGTSPGFYPITLVINYNIDHENQPAITQTAGLQVLAKTSLLVSTEGAAPMTDTAGTSSISVTIANVGDTAVRGVYGKASSDDFVITSGNDKFIGTLNLDDSASMSVSMTPRRGVNASSGILKITVTYKDALNIEHVETTGLDLSIRPSFADSTGATGTTNQRFGRPASQGFSIFGLDPFMVLVGVIILIGAYVGYKWKKRHDK
ncbi:MAG: hypothetical protein V1658_01055 [Candidatus Micrarchaeota archaeon]